MSNIYFMKKNMYILGVIALTIVLLFVIKKLKYEAPLPEKFNNYKYLSEEPIESENYEVVKIIDSWKGRAEVDGIVRLKDVFYDMVTKNILFITESTEYEKIDGILYRNAPYQIFWKMNNQGRAIDSIKSNRLDLDNSGMFFHNDYFIDWVNNGNKTKQRYVDIIDEDNFTRQQLEDLIDKADMLDINKDYENEITNLFLKNKEGWTRIKSKRLYEKTELIYGRTLRPYYALKPYIEIYEERFIKLETAQDSPIETEHFVKRSKSSISFGDFNNNGRSGWSGTGYFKIIHNSESIHFKGYAFDNRLDKTYTYYPTEKSQDFIIFYLHKRSNDDRDFKNTGIYVLRKKVMHLSEKRGSI